MSGIAALVLAAGRSTRYRDAGGTEPTKLVATLQGVPLVRHVARAALATSARPVLIVTGHAREAVEAALAGLDVTFAFNPDYAEGLSTSLRRGLAALPAASAGAIVLLGDMPLVGKGTIDALIETFAGAPDADAVVPVSGGVRGNPVLLGRRLFAAARSLSGDQGARLLLRDPSLSVVERAIATDSVRLDADDPASLARLEGGFEAS